MKRMFMLVLALGLALGGFAQDPQSQAALTNSNVTTVNGVAPGFYPTIGTGLTLNLGAGTANCGGIIQWGGGSFTLTASTTNYVFLNTTSLVNYCHPAVNTTGFGPNIPIAKVVTSTTAITSLDDVRTIFNTGQQGTGGAATFTIVNGYYHYRDLVTYFHPDSGPTGTVEIALPPTITNSSATSVDIIIDGYSWPWGAWTIQIGGLVGFPQCTEGVDAWCGANASITGSFPYSYVRLGYNTSLGCFVVLLGTTTTAWDRLTVQVPSFTPIESPTPSTLGPGWSINILSSEANITNVNKVYNATPYTSVGPVPAEGDASTGNGTETSVNLEVQGASLDVPLLSGATTAVYHYRDLISSYGWASPSELEIALPSTGLVNGATGEISMTLQGYNYTTASAWQVTVGGLAGVPTAKEWGQYSAVVSGNPPFTSVQLGYDTSLSTFVVLLGTTTTAWTYPWVEVSDFIVGYQDESNWGTGWSIKTLTSTSELANVVTPATTWPTGQTVAATSCGSLTGSKGCIVINVNGVGTHYEPYF